MTGKCVILSAPSGSGKTTLVRYLLSKVSNLHFSVSATSRPPRAGEQHAEHYHFLTPVEFKQRIASDDFLEWEEVYTDQFYGTLKSEVQRIWNEGGHVIFDVDVVGGVNLKKELGSDALAVFVKAPSMEIIEERLRARATESEESLSKRLAKVEEEMEFEDQFDTTIVNDELEIAQEEILNTVQQFLGT